LGMDSCLHGSESCACWRFYGFCRFFGVWGPQILWEMGVGGLLQQASKHQQPSTQQPFSRPKVTPISQI
jgi:hypothetical protein